MTKNTFTVRIFVNGSAPMIIKGAQDGSGVYLITREPSGTGYYAISEKRVYIEAADLLPSPDSGADFEFKHVVTTNYF